MRAPPLVALVAAALFAGCARGPKTCPVAEVAENPAPAPASVPEEPAAAPHLAIDLGARVDGPPALVVELRARAFGGRTWGVPALGAADLDGLEAGDDDGAIAATIERDGLALRIELARPPVGELRLRYVIRPKQGVRAPEIPAGLDARISGDRVLVTAEQVLLLPPADDQTLPARVTVELGWEAAPPNLLRVASTLGDLDDAGEVTVAALRHAAFLAGTLGTASFRGPAGVDDFAWNGDTRFDLRWSAAEIAGTRTAVDLYFWDGDAGRFATLLMVDILFPGDHGALVYPRTGGLYVALSPGADWDAPARLAVAQGLVARWIGDRLRLAPAGDGPAERGAWFNVGFTRAIARGVLLDLGTLGADDYLDELHALRGELLTSPLRGESNDALATRAAAGESDAQVLLVARGALYATRLDALLRARGSSLRVLLRALVAEAHERRSAVLLEESFFARIAEVVGEEELVNLRRGVLEGGSIDVPKDALDPCFVPARRTYTRFDLGFDAALSQDVAPMVLRGVRPDGPAAKAGLHEGEPLLSLLADRDDPERPAEIVVERGGEAVEVIYKPLGERVRGLGWRRNAKAPELLCPP